MTSVYRFAADAVVVLHAAYVLFVVVGFLLTLVGCVAKWEWIRNRWFRGVHLAMIAIVVAEVWCGITCPLTVWEQALRERAGSRRIAATSSPTPCMTSCSGIFHRGPSRPSTRVLGWQSR